jgi:myo-inositol-1(or 4)-monophosphatase
MNSLAQDVVDIATQAGTLLMSRRPKENDLTDVIRHATRGDDLKTKTDMASDALIRKIIEKRYPDHSIISEESEPKITGSRYQWVIDPLDGTRPWLRQMCDHFAVSIAVEEDGKVITGVVYAPALNGGKMYHATLGQGTRQNGNLVRVSPITSTEATQLAFSYGKVDKGYSLTLLSKIFGVKGGVDVLYEFGSASVAAALVASGQLDAALMYGLDHWDLAAAKLLLTEAGAHMSLWLSPQGREVMLAANHVLHDKLHTMLTRCA